MHEIALRICEPHFTHNGYHDCCVVAGINFSGTTISSPVSGGTEAMWAALEINIALWGMILCATMGASQQFLEMIY